MILRLVPLFFLWVTTVVSNPIDFTRDKKPFTIEEATLGALTVKSYAGKWISDNEIEYRDKDTKDVKVLDVSTNKTEVLLKNSILSKYNATRYKFSPDRKYVLLTYDENSVFRHTKTAKYVVYSIQDEIYLDVEHKNKLQDADWGPQNSSLVYIKNNNLYVLMNITTDMTPVQVTNSGSSGLIFNGIADWVYEEEVLDSGRAFWLSPEGDQIVFLKLTDTKVNVSVYPHYGEPGNIKNQYEKTIEVRYPKVGTPNPDYELLHVYLDRDLGASETTVLAKSDKGMEIFYNLKWANNDVVYFVLSNRVQNESRTFACNVNGELNCKVVFQHFNKHGWANTNMPLISKPVDRLLRIEGRPAGNDGNFKHLVLYKVNGEAHPLSGGHSEVQTILHWDETRKAVYYLATEENDSTAAQVFVVSEVNGTKPECLTCRIKSPEGNECKDASASFSKGASYAIISCNGPDPRIDYLYRNTLPLSVPIQILEDNAKLRHQLQRKLLPEVMNLSVNVTKSLKADVRLWLPPKMDKTGKTKYPLIIYVYGGPASKAISNSFKFDWGLYLSTNQSVVYAFIDGRNTMKRGEKMLFAGYRALGTVEIEDQINVTRYLQSTFPFIDAKKTAIWGWSYGGYATTKVLEMDKQNTFKCGIAVALVADWLYYDSIYTERYMGLPEENMKGYEKASVLKDVSNLRNKQYFLIHGNADDNVHYQNAMMLAKVLERNNIPFELMSYPDENHSLRSVRNHLYHTMDRFWKKCFVDDRVNTV